MLRRLLVARVPDRSDAAGSWPAAEAPTSRSSASPSSPALLDPLFLEPLRADLTDLLPACDAGRDTEVLDAALEPDLTDPASALDAAPDRADRTDLLAVPDFLLPDFALLAVPVADRVGPADRVEVRLLRWLRAAEAASSSASSFAALRALPLRLLRAALRLLLAVERQGSHGSYEGT